MQNFSRVLIVFFLLFNSHYLKAENGLKWINQIGSIGNSEGVSTSVLDPNGNIIILGTFKGTIDFDPSSSIFNMTAAGGVSPDIYIAKYNPDGALIWVKKIGGIEEENSIEIKLDQNGNIVIVGFYKGAVDFDPSSNVSSLTSTGTTRNTFIAKYTPDGSFIWAKSMVGTNFLFVTSMVIDDTDNIYIYGELIGSFDFDPSLVTYNLTSNGSSDFFIAKYSLDGNFVWANSFGSSLGENASKIDINYANELIVVGSFDGTVDFNPSTFVLNNLTSINDDGFIAKYNLNGDFISVTQLTGLNDEDVYSFAVDNNNDLYITGKFDLSTDFGNTANILNTDAPSNGGTYLAKYSSIGEIDWVILLEGGFSAGQEVILGLNDYIYFSGIISEPADFDPSAGVFINANTQFYDIFFANYSKSGVFISASVIGSPNIEYAQEMEVDNNGDIYLVGNFMEQVDFDPSDNTQLRTPVGAPDGFIAKYCSFTPTSSITGIEEVCGGVGSQVLYSVSNTANSNYLWTVPSGAIISTNTIPNSNTILVDYTNLAIAGQITVKETNEGGCNANLVSKTITPIAMPSTSNINGSINVCGNSVGEVYSVQLTTNSSYQWAVPTGVTLNTGQGTNTITVDFNGYTTLGSIMVVETNDIGCVGNPVTLSINPLPIPVTSAINGLSNACGNVTSVSYSVNSTSGSTYLWTVPTGSSISLGQNSNSITVDFNNFILAGDIIVTETNIQGCTGSTVIKAVSPLPVPSPLTLVGPNSVCENATNISFSVLQNVGSSYTWTKPGVNSTIISGQGTNELVLDFLNYTTPSLIKVIETNTSGCSGLEVSAMLGANLKPALSSITGNTNICGNSKGQVYAVNNLVNVNYNWSGTSGLIQAGQGTNSITIDYNPSTYIPTGNINVLATNTITGCVNTASLNLLFKNYPVFTGSIGGPIIACSPTGYLNYINAANTGNTSSWTLPTTAHYHIGSASSANITIALDQFVPFTIMNTVTLTSSGCTNTTSLSVDIADFTPQITGPSLVCTSPISSGYITYTYSTDNTPASTFIWNKGGASNMATTLLNSSTVGLQIKDVSLPISVTVTHKGCIKTANLTLSAKQPPVGAKINILGPKQVCLDNMNQGQNVNYSLENKHTGYSYKWKEQNAPVALGDTYVLNSYTISYMNTMTTLSATEVDVQDGCPVYTTDKYIYGYPTSLSLQGDKYFCDDNALYNFNVQFPNALSTYNWTVGLGNSTITSGNGTPAIQVQYNSGVTNEYFKVKETNELGCVSNESNIAASSLLNQFSSPNMEVTCAAPTISLPVKLAQGYYNSYLQKLEFCISYDPQYLTSTSTISNILLAIKSQNNLPLNVTISEIVIGQVILTIETTILNDQLQANVFNNIFQLNFLPNNLTFVSGISTTIASCHIKEYYQSGNIQNCRAFTSTISMMAATSSLNGKIVRKGLNTMTPLGYNALIPSQFLPTVIAGSANSGSNLLSSAFYPDLNGEFEYDLSGGNYIYMNRDIISATSVTDYINSLDLYKVDKLINGYYPNSLLGIPTIQDLLAADVTQDGKISVTDFDELQDRALGISSGYSQINGLSRDWVFLKNSLLSLPIYKTSTYSAGPQIIFNVSTTLPIQPESHSIYTENGNGCTNIPEETYYGVLLGDVGMYGMGSSNNETDYFMNQPYSGLRIANNTEEASTILDLSNIEILGNGNIKVPFMVFASDTGVSIDYRLDYDESKITLVDVMSSNQQIDTLLYHAWTNYLNSELRLLGFITDTLAIFSNTPLLYFEFDLNDNTLTEELFGNVTLSKINGRNVEGTIIPILPAVSNQKEVLHKINLFPNPTTNTIKLSGIEGNQYSYSIYNSVGIEMVRMEKHLLNEISLDKLNSGIYTIKIRMSDEEKNFRILKLEE